ncbi:carboxymuconolactone decarboxylase family protein [Emticicia sp. BO119]|uniref:carboxymuconolactone decarboxylase family protein n=1 Tax=Emticicia sp. BO119 TaxID=2757768 RepID=UPI0015F045D3|nr:peroxidase-related enzyme [Emticicia sp. BO119]MBA4853158.1 peroxidase-related enzyme [Emticicia sp. BO119]
MAYIKLPEEELLPGIRGLMAFRPETARPLNALADILLRDESTGLSRGERETIATYVSYLNDCWFCQSVHGAAAQCYLDDDGALIDQIKKNYEEAPVSKKLKTLLAIAANVQKGGKNVTTEQIDAARNEGANDKEIHDTVLIAAAFCMFNRYVDGLGTWAPADPKAYIARGIRISEEGYANFDAMKSIGK